MSLSEKKKFFEQNFKPHIDYLFIIALNLTKNNEDSEDLVQETYLNAFRFMDSFKKGTNSRAWLHQILKNNFLTHHKKKSKELTSVYLHLSEFSNGLESVIFTEVSNIIKDNVENMLSGRVIHAISQLKPDLRVIIILYGLEGFIYTEISYILGIPIGTVRSRLHKARKILRKELKEFAKHR